ncbi:MAG: glycosyltransferase family 2 protein [Planctomycetes bacterium]|nr:glycosyltransferase family 2 protein [Planctomycetota bacterium]
MNEGSESLGLSVVVPMLDEAPVIEELLSRLESVFSDFTGGWEMVAVDDGSTDGTWRLLQEASARRPWLRGVRLARRFGQHQAILAGMDAARGRIVVLMDADLQVQPEDMKPLVERVARDADVAFAVRDHRNEGFLREEIGLKLNAFLAKHSVGAPLKALSTFFAARREVVKAALSFKTSRPIAPFHIMLSGPRKVVWMKARNRVRTKGRSKYGLLRLIAVTLDIFFGYTRLPERTLLAAAVGAPAGAIALWVVAGLWAVAGWERLSSVFLAAGASWAVICLSVLLFVAGHLALRPGAGHGGPLYLVSETF